jgi:hypothetical protein
MVAMLHGETTGGVVYLYDPISERGDKRFAFKAIRLDNPTSDTLEPGPVTVYGDGRFIGEGITEPVPPNASVVVPFALDKQIVVERTGEDDDREAAHRAARHHDRRDPASQGDDVQDHEPARRAVDRVPAPPPRAELVGRDRAVEADEGR